MLPTSHPPHPRYTGTHIIPLSPSPTHSILLLLLSRPPTNAFHTAFWRELGAIFDRIDRDPKIRVVVLASAYGGVFTTGLDVKASKDVLGFGRDPARRALNIHQYILDFQSAITSIANCRQPVVACVSGICVGLGIDIITACDVRLCSEDFRGGVLEINVALAADIGTLQRLPHTTSNSSLMRELCFTGRTFSSSEALALGLVSRVVRGDWEGVVDEGVRVAEVVRGKSPVAVVGVKRLLNHARDHTIQEGLEYTAAWNMSMLQSADTAKAMASFGNKGVKLEYDDLDEAEGPEKGNDSEGVNNGTFGGRGRTGVKARL